MIAKIVDGKLIVEVELNKQPPLSQTGKSYIIASTGGFLKLPLTWLGKPVSISFNAVVPVKGGPLQHDSV